MAIDSGGRQLLLVLCSDDRNLFNSESVEQVRVVVEPVSSQHCLGPRGEHDRFGVEVFRPRVLQDLGGVHLFDSTYRTCPDTPVPGSSIDGDEHGAAPCGRSDMSPVWVPVARLVPSRCWCSCPASKRSHRRLCPSQRGHGPSGSSRPTRSSRSRSRRLHRTSVTPRGSTPGFVPGSA